VVRTKDSIFGVLLDFNHAIEEVKEKLKGKKRKSETNSTS
jgi:hypothetical protein